VKKNKVIIYLAFYFVKKKTGGKFCV